MNVVNCFLQLLYIVQNVGQLFYIQIDIQNNHINKRQPRIKHKTFQNTCLCCTKNDKVFQLHIKSNYAQTETDISCISISKHEIIITEHPPI